MILPKEKRDELTKLRVLRYLSQPLDVDSGRGSGEHRACVTLNVRVSTLV